MVDQPSQTEPVATPLLEVRNAVKRFGSVVALAGVDLQLFKGEVLAVLGDNGAGKSTLIKGLAGVHRLDQGSFLIDGEVVAPRNPLDARRHGIETVYQDLALFDNLSVVANFYAGRELTRPRWLSRFGVLRERSMSQETSARLRDLKVGIPELSAVVGLMSGGQRQAIAVARAASFASRILVLDEPTAALGLRESKTVLDLVRSLPEQGVSVIFISHNLEHVMHTCDRAVVLRRGVKVGELAPTEANHERLVSMIVGAASGAYA